MFKDSIKIYGFDDRKILRVSDLGQDAKDIDNFYSVAPFPNYDQKDTIKSLEEKLMKSDFLAGLKSEIGYGKRIIEVGSGTSQMSIVLANKTNNEVVAFDPSINSLILGQDFAEKMTLTMSFL